MQFRELTDSYQLQKIVKSTRFGTVLRATDSRSGQTVVAKLITVGPSPGLAAGAPEFEKLAGVLGSLRHPNLPMVLDSGFTPDGSAFFVLELLEGKSLDTIASLPPARVLKIVGQALSGLEVLAGRGVAHHNLSLDNVFLATTSAGDQVKLLGLGTAIFRPRGAAAGGAVGPENARFLAPELQTGAPADWRADLYSLALTTCNALGATVGLGDTPVVQMPLAVSFELESDEALRQVLERCLRSNPAARATPREFREALLQALGNQAPAPQMPALGAAVPAAVAAAPPPSSPISSALPPPEPMPAMAPPVQFPAPAMAAQSSSISEPSPALSVPSAAPAASAEALPALDLPPLGDPLPEGDVLQPIDDEVLNALLSVPAPPPRPQKPGQAGAGAKVVPFLKKGKTAPPPASDAPAPAATKAPWFLRPLLLGILAGVVVLAGAAGLVWYLRRPQPAPPPPPKPVFVAEVFTKPPLAQLEEAKLLLAQGDDLKARRTLHDLAFGEQGLLPPEGCRQLDAIQETLVLITLERLPADLQNGLKTGDLEVLRTAVEAASGQEAGLAPDVRANFDRAHGIVDAYGQALAASAQGNHVQVLERFATLQTLLPKMSDPEDLRGKAASALETQAEALVTEAKYGAAIVQLEPLSRTWADRPGLKERIAKYQTYQENETQQEALLAALPNIERRRKPSEALDSMAGIEPTPHLAPRFAEARKRLEEQLARLDQAPPQLVPRDGFALYSYSRGTVINLSFRATDDYQVKDVKFLARPRGGKMRELPLEKSRTGYYTVEIPPSFHQNETVDFYVVAIDLSGHEAFLGSPDKPLQLKRSQGFERLIR